jgi:hypothetical protein
MLRWQLWISPHNALMLIEVGTNLPDGWESGICAGAAHQSEEKSQFLLNTS